MSAQSRALNRLADHCMRLSRDSDGRPYEMPIYTGTSLWEQAADMARRTALEQRWRERIARRLRLPIW
ncbi:hypothetical protein [Streptacidiphilus sp. PAMC 29251]